MLSRLCSRALLRTVAVGCKSIKLKSIVTFVLCDSSADLLGHRRHRNRKAEYSKTLKDEKIQLHHSIALVCMLQCANISRLDSLETNNATDH
jgi:hypothetical protein